MDNKKQNRKSSEIIIPQKIFISKKISSIEKLLAGYVYTTGNALPIVCREKDFKNLGFSSRTYYRVMKSLLNKNILLKNGRVRIPEDNKQEMATEGSLVVSFNEEWL